MYFNPGPARLPYHHQGILSYCRELGVPLEVMSNDNRGALLQSDAAFDGRPQRNRQVVNDIRGYVAELAAKALDHDALTQAGHHRGQGPHPRSAAKLRRARSGHGLPGLRSRRLCGTTGRRRTGRHAQPAARSARDTRCRLLAFETNFGESWEQAATMLQPVGGMGRIGAGVRPGAGRHDQLRRRGPRSAPQRRTARGSSGGTPGQGANASIEAPLVVITIPLPVLRGIPADFAPEVRAAIEAVDYVPAVKVAFQAERRFWELDEAIYGGISWTDARHHPGLVSVGRHPPTQGHPGRRLYLVGRTRQEVRRHAAGRTA